jgi:hypothetical protein
MVCLGDMRVCIKAFALLAFDFSASFHTFSSPVTKYRLRETHVSVCRFFFKRYAHNFMLRRHCPFPSKDILEMDMNMLFSGILKISAKPHTFLPRFLN